MQTRIVPVGFDYDRLIAPLEDPNGVADELEGSIPRTIARRLQR